MAYCGKCGNQLEESAKFCPKCGNPCAHTSYNITEKSNSKFGIPKFILLAVIIILSLLGGYYLFTEVTTAKIQAKINNEKQEQKRLEEEEHRRWEEENKGVAELYKDVSKRKSAPWCVYSYEREYRKSPNRKQIVYVIWLYPSSETSGEAHFVQFHTKFTYGGGYSWIAWTPDKYYSYSSGRDYYCISPYEVENGEIHVQIPVRDAVSDKLMKLSFSVSDDAKSLTLLRQGWQFKRGCGTNDPFK